MSEQPSPSEVAATEIARAKKVTALERLLGILLKQKRIQKLQGRPTTLIEQKFAQTNKELTEIESLDAPEE